MTHHRPSNSFSFFNLAIPDFLQNCACVGRDLNDRNLSADRDLARRTLEKKIEPESLSSFSGVDWTDLEEIPMVDPEGNPYDLSFNDANYVPNHQNDNFETLEPIDFEYLKQITKDPVAKDLEVIKSISSGLSKDSKKIAKDTKTSPTSGKQAAAKKTVRKGKRNPWQPHEDAQLLELMKKHGQSWTIIGTMMEGRSAKQIRDRYLHILRPNIKKGDWTPQEDQHILALYYQYGHKWSKIATMVEGRTEGQVKNRFYSHIKKKLLKNEGLDNPPAQVKTGQQDSQKDFEEIKIDSPGFSSEMASTTDGKLHSATITPSHAVENKNNAKGQRFDGLALDPNNLISYQHGDTDEFGYRRNGSNEKFLVQQAANLGMANGMNHFEGTGQRMAWVEENAGGHSPMSTFSIPSNNSNFSKIRDERDVDQMLDRMTHFYARGNSVDSGPNQEGDNSTPNTLSAHHMSISEKSEQLSKRRSALEYLLLKTMEEMNRFAPQQSLSGGINLTQKI